MPLILNGTTGVSGVDGSAGTPSYQGNDTNTGIFYPAADTIAFAEGGTEVMRIDSSGNVLVGTTATFSGGLSTQKVLSYGTSDDAGFSALRASANSGGSRMVLGKSRGATYTIVNSGDGLGILSFQGADGSTLVRAAEIAGEVDGTPGANDMPGRLVFSTTADGAASPTERMRIASDGNVGIGTTVTSGARLTIRGAGTTSSTASLELANSAGNTRFYVRDDGTTSFYGASFSETVRITSGGEVCIGATATVGSARFYLEQNLASNQVCRIVASNASTPFGVLVNYSGAAPNGTSNEFLVCSDTGATRAAIRSNGGLANFSANNVNLSDAREKTNIELAGSYLDKICSIPVKTFNYIDQNLESDDGLTLGVIAQDVQAVAPELVCESDWGTKKEPKMRLSIYQTDLQYALMKCIQEQQAMIEELKAKVAALEK